MTARSESPDLRVSRLARRHDDVFSAAELRALGLERDAVRRRVAKVLLHRVHPGVFAVRPDLAPRGQMRAALLSCGHSSWLGGRSAVYAWEFIDELRPPVEVVVYRRRIQREGIDVCSTTWLPELHRLNRLGLAATSPARALLDFGVNADPGLHEHAIAAAIRARWTTEGGLRELAATGRPGAPALRVHLDRLGGARFSRSKAERILMQLCREARLPPPLFNERVHGRERDVVWRDARVVAEFDGDAFHWSPASKRNDHRRDADLVLRGWRTLRITWHELTEEPLVVAAPWRGAGPRLCQIALCICA